MTRTARASYPGAINKDRSQPKNGMDKRIPKRGGGTHNWGRLEDELEIEQAALEDEEAEFEETSVPVTRSARRGSSLSSAEAQQGIEFGNNALKSPAPAFSAAPKAVFVEAN